MKPAAKDAFTLIELLVVIALLAFFFSMIHSPHSRAKFMAKQIQCLSNLRELGCTLVLYAGDNKDRFPWQVSTNAVEEGDPIKSSVASVYFSVVTNFIQQPNVYVCPTDKTHKPATSVANLNNTNLSYFASLSATVNATSNASHLILAGDRHLAVDGRPVKPGACSVSTNAALSWTKELHESKGTNQRGVLLFVDVHAEITSTKNLDLAFKKQSIATTRLVIP